jgi:hypothetical protein
VAEGDEPTPDEYDLTRWGWVHVFMSLANRDVTKLDAISTIPARELFTYMSYLVDHNQYEQYSISKLQRSHR